MGNKTMNLFSLFKRAWGVLQSRNRIGIKIICIRLISPITIIIDKLFSVFLPKFKINTNTIPPVLMIVSPPRAGATVIYQVITRTVPCVYISNMHLLFPSVASYFMKKFSLFNCKSTNLKNYYGYTAQLNDVYEGNEFIDKIFQGNPDEVKIRNRFLQLLKKIRPDSNHPFIFKNARNYKNILRLYKAVPEIRFLIVKRDLEEIIQSELKAHYELGTFHPIPESLRNIETSSPLEFVVMQITEIVKKIDHQKQMIPEDNYTEWNYKEFCKIPVAMIELLANNFFNIKPSQLKKNYLQTSLKASKRKKVTDEEAQKIRALLKKYKSV